MRKRLAVLPLTAVWALGAGCTRDAPTAPFSEQSAVAPAPSVGAANFSISGSPGLFSSPAIDDLSTRLVGGFTDEAAAVEMRTQLRSLDAAVASGDADAARAAISIARQVVDPKGDGSSITVGDRADIAVILLVLEQIEQTLR